jgi:rhombotail lipoprotein
MAAQRGIVLQRMIGLLVFVVIAAGCVTGTALQRRSNALEFLYPEGKEAEPPRDVVLEVPLRVGLAFAPDTSAQGNMTSVLAAQQQQRLLARVAEAFATNRSVRRIELLPPHYLEPRGGFRNVDRVSAALDLGVIALVSYDQFQFTDTDRLRSLAYWTLIGVHFVKGERNQTRTLMDVVVYDVRSRALLFRAAGDSVVVGRAAPIGLAEERRNQSEAGFGRAADVLIDNLKTAFGEFSRQAAAGTVRGPGTPAIRIARVSDAGDAAAGGGAGGGAFGFLEVLVTASLAAVAWRRRRRS